MTALPRLRVAHELLDDPAVDERALEDGLDDVGAINRWLGGTRAVLRALDSLVPAPRPLRILDVGCGHADVPLAIVRRARRRGAAIRIVGAELHALTIRVAQRRTAGQPIDVVRADARALPFADRSFDVALLSLTLHHLADHEQLPALRELARVARIGVVVNELHRSRVHHLGARLLAATLWRRRPVTRHDAPVSVLRAFTPRELRELACAAGLQHVRVRRRFFYRLVLTGSTPTAAAAARTDSK